MRNLLRNLSFASPTRLPVFFAAVNTNTYEYVTYSYFRRVHSGWVRWKLSFSMSFVGTLNIEGAVEYLPLPNSTDNVTQQLINKQMKKLTSINNFKQKCVSRYINKNQSPHERKSLETSSTNLTIFLYSLLSWKLMFFFNSTVRIRGEPVVPIM